MAILDPSKLKRLLAARRRKLSVLDPIILKKGWRQDGEQKIAVRWWKQEKFYREVVESGC